MTSDGPNISQWIHLSDAFGVAGSSDHDADGYNHEVIEEAFAELHPAAAGRLIRHIRRGIERDDGAVASGSEHPDWHAALERAIENSDPEGYQTDDGHE